MGKYNVCSDIQIQRLEEFFQGQIFPTLSSFVSAIGLFAIFYENMGTTQALWLVFAVIFFALRGSVILFFQKVISPSSSTKLPCISEKVYSLIILLSSIHWGYSVYVFSEIAVGGEFVIIVLFPMCLFVGAVNRMYQSQVSTIAYTIGVVGSFSSYFMNGINIRSTSIILLAILFSYYMIQTALKNFERYVELLVTIKEKDELLQVAKENHDLQEEIIKQKAINTHNSKLNSLGEMAAGIAHEMNSPLAVIRLNAESALLKIERGNLDIEKVKTSYRNICNVVDDIAEITASMLILSRNDEIKKGPLSIQKVIDSALALSKQKFSYYGIKIEHDNIRDYFIEGNTVAIMQVLTNLLNNSFYFIKNTDSPWIKIEVFENDDNQIEVKFSDSGAAIDLDVQKKLFEPFFTTKPVGDGTGLGLSISRSILNDHHGTLCYTGNIHPSFSLTFPPLTYQ